MHLYLYVYSKVRIYTTREVQTDCGEYEASVLQQHTHPWCSSRAFPDMTTTWMKICGLQMRDKDLFNLEV